MCECYISVNMQFLTGSHVQNQVTVLSCVAPGVRPPTLDPPKGFYSPTAAAITNTNESESVPVIQYTDGPLWSSVSQITLQDKQNNNSLLKGSEVCTFFISLVPPWEVNISLGGDKVHQRLHLLQQLKIISMTEEANLHPPERGQWRQSYAHRLRSLAVTFPLSPPCM